MDSKRDPGRISKDGCLKAALAAAILSLLPVSHCPAQGTLQPLVITFDGLPPQPPGTQYHVAQYSESGMTFAPIEPPGPGVGILRNGGGNTDSPENHTAYIQAGGGDSLAFSFDDGRTFSLAAVDLAEYSALSPYPVTVHFVGYRGDGSVVTADMTTDGIIDGTGPLPDFQTFSFGPEFSALTRVEVPLPADNYSLDNLQVLVPEPSLTALAGLGALMAARKSRRKRRGQSRT